MNARRRHWQRWELSNGKRFCELSLCRAHYGSRGHKLRKVIRFTFIIGCWKERPVYWAPVESKKPFRRRRIDEIEFYNTKLIQCSENHERVSQSRVVRLADAWASGTIGTSSCTAFSFEVRGSKTLWKAFYLERFEALKYFHQSLIQLDRRLYWSKFKCLRPIDW